MRSDFFSSVLLGVFMGVGMVSPLVASAQSASSELPFGGQHLFVTQCTCAADSLHYILDYTTNRVLALLYEPSSRLYSNYNVYGGIYQLGSYMPTGQQCMITTGASCTGIYADGMYGNQPGTGTSFATGFRMLASAFSPFLGGQDSPRHFFKIRPVVLRKLFL